MAYGKSFEKRWKQLTWVFNKSWGGTLQDRRRFYTDLFHALSSRKNDSRDVKENTQIWPAEFSSDQQFLWWKMANEVQAFQFKIHSGVPKGPFNTLWHLVYPRDHGGVVNSMLSLLSRWRLIQEVFGRELHVCAWAGVRVYPLVWVSAYQKGIRGFDVAMAFGRPSGKSSPWGLWEKAGYEHRIALGGGLSYLPWKMAYYPWLVPGGKNSAFIKHWAPSLTLEYALIRIWTLAQFAKSTWRDYTSDWILEPFQLTMPTPLIKISADATEKCGRGNGEDAVQSYEYNAGFNEANGSQGTLVVPHWFGDG